MKSLYRIVLSFLFYTLWVAAHDLKTPPPMALEQAATHYFPSYLSGSKARPFAMDTLYILGYNNTAIAYIIEYDMAPSDIVHIEVYIQDLVSDKILWHDAYRVEDKTAAVNFQSFWQKKHTLIEQKLKAFEIIPLTLSHIRTGEIKHKGDSLQVGEKNRKSFIEFFQREAVKDSIIYLVSAKYGKKTIEKKYYKEFGPLERKAIGYIPLGKDSKRIAVVVATLFRGWEGPPHNLSFSLVGAHLEKGF